MLSVNNCSLSLAKPGIIPIIVRALFSESDAFSVLPSTRMLPEQRDLRGPGNKPSLKHELGWSGIFENLPMLFFLLKEIFLFDEMDDKFPKRDFLEIRIFGENHFLLNTKNCCPRTKSTGRGKSTSRATTRRVPLEIVTPPPLDSPN